MSAIKYILVRRSLYACVLTSPYTRRISFPPAPQKEKENKYPLGWKPPPSAAGGVGVLPPKKEEAVKIGGGLSYHNANTAAVPEEDGHRVVEEGAHQAIEGGAHQVVEDEGHQVEEEEAHQAIEGGAHQAVEEAGGGESAGAGAAAAAGSASPELVVPTCVGDAVL